VNTQPELAPTPTDMPNDRNILDLLREWSAADDGSRSNALHVAAQQFRLRKPQWWVVNGKTAVPIWMVERLRKSSLLLS
jgi:hypothetical protein